MDIDALKTFLEIYRTRHFGRAAENLYLSQSAVSARIRMLEQEVGVPLFNRQRNNIELTPAGQKLLAYAENILVTWNRARQEIGSDAPGRIPFVIGCTPSLWDILLQDLVTYAHSQQPDLIIHADIHDQAALIRQARQGMLDMAFCFDYPADEGLQVREVCQVTLRLYSTRQGQNVQQALAKDYILVDWGSSFASAHAQHFPDCPSPSMRMALGRMARDLLLSHGGSAYLATSMVRDELAKGLLFEVEDAPTIVRSAYVVYSSDSEKAATVRLFMDFFQPGRQAQQTDLVETIS